MIAIKFMPTLIKLGIPRKLRRTALTNVAAFTARVLDVHAIRVVKLARHYAMRAFKYKNPQPGHIRGTLVASMWRGDVKKSRDGMMIEVGSAVHYDDILEFGPKKKTWVIVPTGKRKLISPIGPQKPGRRKYTKTKFLRWYVGGIARYAKKVTRHWTKASLRPHWEPAMKFDDPTFAKDLAEATIQGVLQAIHG